MNHKTIRLIVDLRDAREVEQLKKSIWGELNMSKYGRPKRAFFEDGMIIETDHVSHLKRCVRERRNIERYFGRVWFRPCDAWVYASGFLPFRMIVSHEEDRPSDC